MIPYSALFLLRFAGNSAEFAILAVLASAPLMALSLDDIQRLAHLARIEVTPAEAVAVAQKLDGIFELIGRMRAVDTTGIVPMSHAQDLSLPLREDRVTETDQREAFQRLAPAAQDGLYLVPRVIE
jgi:aspartyl-tRNA(Asn)/glutamyl-tRNA(Gln) amidotransferase subunit C